MKFMMGLGLIVLAFFGVGIILYMMSQATLQQQEKIKTLDDQVAELETQKNIIELEVEHLKSEADSIKLSTLVNTANSIYDDKERARREGVLWIDRKNKTYVVTLGAIHGLTTGSTLNIYDGDKKIGTLRVDTPYDVISFTAPVKPLDNVSDKNYFRVRIE